MKNEKVHIQLLDDGEIRWFGNRGNAFIEWGGGHWKNLGWFDVKNDKYVANELGKKLGIALGNGATGSATLIFNRNHIQEVKQILIDNGYDVSEEHEPKGMK